MKKLISVAVLAAMMFGLLAGCSSEKETGSEKESDKVSIGICFDTFVVERWERDRDVFVSTAIELGAEVDVQNPNGDVQEQVSALEYFIDKKVDVIVVVPIESKPLVDVIKKAKDKGIKVISYDRLIADVDVDTYISFDNEAVGTLMAIAMEEKLNKGDRVVMICGPQTDSNVEQVAAGFEKQSASSGFVQVDKVYLEEWKSELAYEYVNNNLSLIGSDVKGIMCGNDNLASQVVYALSENRLLENILVTGQDADLDACQRIVEGTQYATVYKPVNLLAAQAAHTAVELATGKEIVYDSTINNGKFDIPYIKLAPRLVTKDNMDSVIIEEGFHNRSDVYINVE